jgi:SAM-dependent methyltransferase
VGDEDRWQNFWDTGTPTSVAGAFEAGYDGEILSFWESHLGVGDLNSIVDLACGNGALTWLLDTTRNDPVQRSSIVGIDFADIDPLHTLGINSDDHPMVSFIGSTSIESLPLESGSVDAAVSQWGLEYSDIAKTVPEIARVLRPTSAIFLVCHTADSDILKRSKLLAPKYRIVLDRPELFELLFQLNDLYNAHTNIKQVRADPGYAALIASLNQIIAACHSELDGFDDPTVADIQGYLKALLDLFSNISFVRMPGRAKAIAYNKSMLELGAVRFDDLFAAALSEENYRRLCGLIESEGFTIEETGEIIQTGLGSIGKSIVARRNL